MSRDFVGALLQLNAEKQISREQLIGAVEDGIQSAYRRVAGDEDIHVRIDAETGKIRVFRARRVVGEIEDEFTEMTVEQAHAYRPRRRPRRPRRDRAARRRRLRPDRRPDGQADRPAADPRGRARPGLRPVREPRRRADDRHGQPGRAAGDHPRRRQERRGDPRHDGAVRRSSTTGSARTSRRSCSRSGAPRRAPRSSSAGRTRASSSRLFELEVPEIHSGTVEIKAIAREAGSRSKIAVSSRQDGLDPVGATVGQRGARVQAVVAELSGEKIDVIPWSDDPAVFVANALSPAQVISVDIDEEHRIASVTVPERMLSLAIGREGQNARLAARLTGWRIDIRSDVSVAEAKAAAADAADAAACRGWRDRVDRAGRGTRSRRRRTDGGDRRGHAKAEAHEEARSRGRRRGESSRCRRCSRMAPAESETAAPKPRRTSKTTAKPASATDATNGTNPDPAAEAAAPAKPKRTRKAATRPPPRRWRRRPGRAGRSPRGASRTAPASPAGRSVRSAICCGSSGPRRARHRSIRPAAPHGRGAYVCRSTECIDNAIKKGALSRALKTPLPADLREALVRSADEPDTPSKEEPVARSRSGTRGRRGPRKPPRRDGAFAGAGVQIARPARARRDRAARHDHRQGARRAARRQPGRHHPRADQERHLRDDQPADRPRHRVAGRRRARLRGGRGRRVPERHGTDGEGDGAVAEATKEVLYEEDDAVAAPAARPDRDRHGPRRPRQDEPARRHPDDRGRGRRARWHHPAHRRQRGHPGRQARRVPRHAGSRGVHGHARPRRPGHRHRGGRRRRRRRRHAPDARGDQPRQGGQGADRHRAQQDRQARCRTRIGSRPS